MPAFRPVLCPLVYVIFPGAESHKWLLQFPPLALGWVRSVGGDREDRSRQPATRPLPYLKASLTPLLPVPGRGGCRDGSLVSESELVI